jgi:hypothetical protein
VDRNYNLELDLLKTREKMAAMLSQNKLLQEQLAAQYTVHAETDSNGQGDNVEEEPAVIHGGGTDWGEQDNSSPEAHNYGVIHYVDNTIATGTLLSVTLSSFTPIKVPSPPDNRSEDINIQGLHQGTDASSSSYMILYNKSLEMLSPLNSPPSSQNHASPPQKSDDGYLSGRGGSS